MGSFSGFFRGMVHQKQKSVSGHVCIHNLHDFCTTDRTYPHQGGAISRFSPEPDHSPHDFGKSLPIWNCPRGGSSRRGGWGGIIIGEHNIAIHDHLDRYQRSQNLRYIGISYKSHDSEAVTAVDGSGSSTSCSSLSCSSSYSSLYSC